MSQPSTVLAPGAAPAHPTTPDAPVASSRRWLPPVVLVALTVLALAVRWQFLTEQSGDYRAFLDPWYTHLAQSGGFSGLADSSFSNYNTPYLVLIAALTYLPVPQLAGIKALSIVFDVVLAVFVSRVVGVLRPGSRWLPVAAYGVTLLLPTVVLNSSWWAQCDAIYTAFCAASLYFLLRRRPALACALFGLAFAFKLQAVFFLPVLVVLLVVNRHKLRSLLLVPLTFFAALVPALVAGRSLSSQLSVYPAQITNSSGNVGGGTARTGGGVRPGGGGGFTPGGAPGGTPGGGHGGLGGGGRAGGFGGGGGGTTSTHSFTNNAPTPYAWLPADASTTWKYVGLGVAAAVCLALLVWLVARRRRLAVGEMVLVAATLSLVVPVLLPEMHERYFYLAEVLAIAGAFVDKRFIAVAAAMQVATGSTYLSYLTGTTVLPLGVASVVALGAAVLATVVLVLRLRRPRVEAPTGAAARAA